MKKSFLTLLAVALVLLSGCCDKTPRVKHVIFLGFDGQGSYGVQRAETPNFNYMIENGAVALDVRSVRSTSSSQNWMSMVSGAPIEVHGVWDNDWEMDNRPIALPTTLNKLGLFPTMWDDIRASKPDAKIYGYVEWSGETRMYDMSVFDKGVWNGNGDGNEYSADDLLDRAFADYLADEPDFMFVSIDVPDHAGHAYGHEDQGYFDCIHHMDERVGEFIKALEERNMLKDAIVIITADHGGIRYGHGGDDPAEMKVPVILYGKGVTKGKVIEHTCMIYDCAATVCGLLGVEMPAECHGKFLKEAFEPKTSVCYTPLPLIHPFKGVVKEGEKVSITADAPGVEIYYTLDGTVPTTESIKYEGPFELPESCTVQAVSYKNGNYSWMASNFLYNQLPAGERAVEYKLYKNYTGEKLPDFTKFGKADAVGYVASFNLNELPVPTTEDDFAVIFNSTLVIPEDGVYTFELASDDGAKFYIDRQLAIDNDGSHSLISRFTTLELKAGDHPVRVEYFEDCDGQDLDLKYAPQGKTPRPIFPTELKK